MNVLGLYLNKVNQKKLHITRLVIFQLFVFLVPLTIKSSHYHTSDSYSKHNIAGYTNTEKSCQICKFEFVISNNNETPQYIVYQPITPITRSIKTNQKYNKVLIYYSNRAPPLT